VRSDAEFVAAFESCALPNTEFHHADHIRLAWIYLRELPLVEALERFRGGLKRFAAHHGVPGLYHETITWAYLLLIHERMERSASSRCASSDPAADFATFRRLHPDLFAWKPSLLEAYYRPETLGSELARRVFVLPDRGIMASASAPA